MKMDKNPKTTVYRVKGCDSSIEVKVNPKTMEIQSEFNNSFSKEINEKMNTNPWQVDSIWAFSCLKCPECEFYSKEEDYFRSHAMANHPGSAVLFGKYKVI